MASATVALSNGVLLPRLGFGTHTLRGDVCEVAVQRALECGYRQVDTASIYKNEEEVKRGISRANLRRQDVFITSKCSPYELNYEKTRGALESTLAKLGTAYIDLYLIHWPGVARVKHSSSEHREARSASWKALEDAYMEGKCRAIGVSNYSQKHLEELLSQARVAPHVNQIEFHPQLQRKALCNFCANHGIALQAYSPLGCGELLHHKTVTGIAREMDCSAAQLLLLWCLHKGTVPLPRSSSEENIKANFRVQQMLLDGVTLSSAHLAEMDSMDQGRHFCWSSDSVL